MKINWKPIKIIRAGKEKLYDFNTPERCEPQFLESLKGLARKKPLSWEQAIQLFINEFDQLFFEKDAERLNWLCSHEVQWFSDSGYHIELNGDEYSIVEKMKFENFPEENNKEKPIQLDLTWGGKAYRLVTFASRPPILSLNFKISGLEIYYVTGESEMARDMGDCFMPITFLRETLYGETSPIQKFCIS